MGTSVADTAAGLIEYTDAGTGPVVLLLHGACSSGRERVVHPPLSRAGFRLIIPSRPGHGRTPLAVGGTPAEAADAVAGLLHSLAVARVMVVAVSTGAPTGAVFAARHPDLVAGLVLESAVVRPLCTEILACHGIRGRLLRLVAILAPRRAAARLLAATSSHEPRGVHGSSDSYASHGARRTSELLRRADLEAVRRFCADRHSRVGALADRSHAVDDTVLAAIRTPTLVVHGRRDRVVPIVGAERAAALIPGARVFARATAGHFLWLGPGAEQTTQRVIAFLKECAARD